MSYEILIHNVYNYVGKDKNLKIGNGTEQFIYICVSIFNELSWILDIIFVLLAIALFKGIKMAFFVNSSISLLLEFMRP
jgi:hypothetical protein